METDRSWARRSSPGPVLELTGLARSANGVSLFNRVDLFRDGEIVAYQQPVGSTIAWSFQQVLLHGERHFYFVRVRQVDGDYAWSAPIWVEAVVDPAEAAEAGTDAGLALLRLAPNPFASGTRVGFELPGRTGSVVYRTEVEVLDLAGRRIGAMGERLLGPGRHDWRWVAGEGGLERPPAGIYFCRLLLDGRPVASRRMIFLP